MAWYRANQGVLPPNELAAGAYQQLVRIHPFVDSNGRTTRLVMDWILQRNGFAPATFQGIPHEAVHTSTSELVYNVDRGIAQATETLTRTTDTTARPGVTVTIPPPSSSKGFLGKLGGD